MQLNEPAPEKVAPTGGQSAYYVTLWVVLALLVGSYAFLQQVGRQTPAPIAQQAGPAPPNLMLRLIGRYAVGAKLLSGLAGQSSPQEMEQIVDQAQQAVQSPADWLRIAALEGELIGRDRAIARLSGIAGNASYDPPLRDDARAMLTLYQSGPDALSANRQARLIAHHDWFGQLAISFERAPTDPARRAAAGPAIRTIAVIISAFIGVIVAMILGLALLVVAIAMVAGGSIRGALTPTPAARSGAGLGLLEALILFLLGTMALTLIIGPLILVLTGIDTGWLLVWTLPALALWPMARGMQWPELKKALGWHRGRGFFLEFGAGLLGYVAGLPIIAVGVVITLILASIGRTDPSHPIVQDSPVASPLQIVQLYVLAVVWAPIVEELFFRGAFYYHLRTMADVVTSSAVVAFVFAAIHPQGWAAIPALMCIAIVLCLLREWRGSIIAPIAGHALNNGTLVTVLVLAVG